MTTVLPMPEIGSSLPCMLCMRDLPWGVFDSKTGAVVCKECRDAAFLARSNSSGE